MTSRFLAFIAAVVLTAFPGSVALLRSNPADDANVAGTWDMTVESPQGTAHPLVVLRQSGSRVTGTYRGRLGEVSLQGSVRDNRIQFSVTLKFQDQPITVTYTGTVDREAMTGTAQFGDAGSGTWSAQRRTS
jgi:hypothetical protein